MVCGTDALSNGGTGVSYSLISIEILYMVLSFHTSYFILPYFQVKISISTLSYLILSYFQVCMEKTPGYFHEAPVGENFIIYLLCSNSVLNEEV